MRKLYLVYMVLVDGVRYKTGISRHGLWKARQDAKALNGVVEELEWFEDARPLIAMRLKWVAKLGKLVGDSQSTFDLATKLWNGNKCKRSGALPNFAKRQKSKTDKDWDKEIASLSKVGERNEYDSIA